MFTFLKKYLTHFVSNTFSHKDFLYKSINCFMTTDIQHLMFTKLHITDCFNELKVLSLSLFKIFTTLIKNFYNLNYGLAILSEPIT